MSKPLQHSCIWFHQLAIICEVVYYTTPTSRYMVVKNRVTNPSWIIKLGLPRSITQLNSWRKYLLGWLQGRGQWKPAVPPPKPLIRSLLIIRITGPQVRLKDVLFPVEYEQREFTSMAEPYDHFAKMLQVYNQLLPHKTNSMLAVKLHPMLGRWSGLLYSWLNSTQQSQD